MRLLRSSLVARPLIAVHHPRRPWAQPKGSKESCSSCASFGLPIASTHAYKSMHTSARHTEGALLGKAVVAATWSGLDDCWQGKLGVCYVLSGPAACAGVCLLPRANAVPAVCPCRRNQAVT